MLAPLCQHGLDLWNDKKIKAGQQWQSEIEQALKKAKIAILLVSPGFLKSEFIRTCELPKLLKQSEARGLIILWIPIEASLVSHTEINKYQALSNPEQPLGNLTRAKADKVLKEIGDQLAEILKRVSDQPSHTAINASTIDSRPSAATTSESPEIVQFRGAPYLVRAKEEMRCMALIERPGNLLRIRSPEKMGKSSLVARIMDRAKDKGYRTAIVNLRDEFPLSIIRDSDNTEILNTLCSLIWEQVHGTSETDFRDLWKPSVTAIRNYFNFLGSQVLPASDRPLVLAIDNLDSVFSSPHISDLLGLLRGCYEKANSLGEFQKLRQVIIYSQEAYGIQNIDQSPLNIGEPIELGEFTKEEIHALARASGHHDWTDEKSELLMQIVGGHPFLVQQALSAIGPPTGLTLGALIQESYAGDGGPFSQHLYEHLLKLEKNPQIYDAMKQVISSETETRLATKEGFQLLGMGLVREVSSSRFRIRCNLYQTYFTDRMR